ncbi:MAG: 4-alpha-glucanotransferase [Caldilineae bacterium]|nr:MAG: 4-alpha-glucanotransferase [Caldilineae bacterium]
MDLIRSSGILLHPTSFPGPNGIGELGPAAFRFLDFLAEAKQSLWQILPLGPTGYGDSPYAAFSTFAGNPLLISLDALLEAGDLTPADLAGRPDFPLDAVDFGAVIRWKLPLLRRAARRFLSAADPSRKADFDAFCARHAHWLDDFALFMAVKEVFDRRAQAEGVFGAMWSNYWDEDIALRRPEALARWRKEQAEAIAVQKVLQFYFFRQWEAVRRYANRRGIRIIGDIPIFVAPDSADVWANRPLFRLDGRGRPTVVAGVPPDYFSPTGQLWGNPLYNWPEIARRGYRWWIERIRATLEMVDIVRIDHFRGFEAYWEIPAAEETAVNGRWVEAPGMELFTAIERELGDLPIIAEDLGVITPGVIALRERFRFPGMKVLQFAFDRGESGALGATNPFLPHNYERRAVVYTGTHDNDTTLGWYRKRSEAEKDLVRRYLGRPDHDIVWEFIRLAMASVAAFAIIPFQDVLNLDSDARMNTPSTLGGNWAWRYRPEALSGWAAGRLREMVDLYGRDPAMWQSD